MRRNYRTRNVGNGKTFTPTRWKSSTRDYKVKLQEGLTINLEETPHRFLGRLNSKLQRPGNSVAARTSNAEMYAVVTERTSWRSV